MEARALRSRSGFSLSGLAAKRGGGWRGEVLSEHTNNDSFIHFPNSTERDTGAIGEKSGLTALELVALFGGGSVPHGAEDTALAPARSGGDGGRYKLTFPVADSQELPENKHLPNREREYRLHGWSARQYGPISPPSPPRPPAVSRPADPSRVNIRPRWFTRVRMFDSLAASGHLCFRLSCLRLSAENTVTAASVAR